MTRIGANKREFLSQQTNADVIDYLSLPVNELRTLN